VRVQRPSSEEPLDTAPSSRPNLPQLGPFRLRIAGARSLPDTVDRSAPFHNLGEANSTLDLAIATGEGTPISRFLDVLDRE
jgi:hypothetical protein